MSSPKNVKNELESAATYLRNGNNNGAYIALCNTARHLRSVLDDYEDRIRKLESDARDN